MKNYNEKHSTSVIFKMNLKVTKEEGLALRGLAIVLIVIHNVTRFMTDFEENEFVYNKYFLLDFLNQYHEHPVIYLFSFYGWLGVSIFVFLSGYGLSVRYNSEPLQPVKWFAKHYFKLFFLMLPALIAYLLIRTYISDIPMSPKKWGYMIIEPTLTLNILNWQAIDPGVFWYFGLAIQLYFIFLFTRNCSLHALSGLIIIFMILMIALPPFTLSFVRHNFLGWMPEFLFGIMVAKMNFNEITTTKRIILFLAGGIMAFFCSLTHFTFTFSGIAFIMMGLAIKDIITKIPGIAYLGIISASLFAVHPALRALWFSLPFKKAVPDPLYAALIVLGASIAVAIGYNQYYRFIRKTVNSFRRDKLKIKTVQS